jgi:hypothetical protein
MKLERKAVLLQKKRLPNDSKKAFSMIPVSIS